MSTSHETLWVLTVDLEHVVPRLRLEGQHVEGPGVAGLHADLTGILVLGLSRTLRQQRVCF